jgi:pimeloyl-ACP methyl ester carboxylesterase
VSPIRHRVTANGLDHSVLEWEPSGVRAEATPSVAVLLHGFMDAAGTWDIVAPSLAALGMRVLAPDMRGFGDAPRVPRGAYYHFADYVADLADLVDAAAPEPLYLVGHSMGGTIATLFTGAFPDRVAKLALLEGLGPPDNPPDAAPDRMRNWIDDVRRTRTRADAKSIASIDDAFRRLVVNHPGVAHDVLRSRLAHLVRDLGDGRVAWRFDPLHRTVSPTPFNVRSFIAFAKRVKCPTLYVSGGPMGFHPDDEAARLAGFANLTRREIADAGHMMHWTKPDRVASLLVAFVTAS